MARASAFQAEGRGFESRLPLHFFAYCNLAIAKIAMTGRGSCAPPPTLFFCLLQLGYRQDCNDGPGGAPLRLLPHQLQLRFSYCNLAVAKIAMTGKGSTASLAPPPIAATFCLLQLGCRQDCNDGPGGAPLRLLPHPLQLRFAYCNLAVAKIAMTDTLPILLAG